MPDDGTSKDSVFTGSIPRLYESHMVPLVFEPSARDIVGRLGGRDLSRVLEVAAGTGVVTRVLADVLPESVAIVATDLNQEMLDEGAHVGTSRPVEWRQADAMQLPTGVARRSRNHLLHRGYGYVAIGRERNWRNAWYKHLNF